MKVFHIEEHAKPITEKKKKKKRGNLIIPLHALTEELQLLQVQYMKQSIIHK